jgi:hypothetical protein
MALGEQKIDLRTRRAAPSTRLARHFVSKIDPRSRQAGRRSQQIDLHSRQIDLRTRRAARRSRWTDRCCRWTASDRAVLRPLLRAEKKSEIDITPREKSAGRQLLSLKEDAATLSR